MSPPEALQKHLFFTFSTFTMPPDSLVHRPFLHHQSQPRVSQPVLSHVYLSEQLGQEPREQGQEKALTQEAKIRAGAPRRQHEDCPARHIPLSRQTLRTRGGNRSTTAGGWRWGTSPGAPSIVQASSKHHPRKTSIIHGVYNASHNELALAETLVKGCVLLTDSAGDPQR